MHQEYLKIRQATLADLPSIVRLIAEDDIVGWRERLANPLPTSYSKAFRAIESDPNNELIVAELDGDIMAHCRSLTSPTLSIGEDGEPSSKH